MKQQKEYLSNLTFDENRLKIENEQLLKLTEEIARQRYNVKKAVFDNKLIHFESEKHLDYAELLGFLYFVVYIS